MGSTAIGGLLDTTGDEAGRGPYPGVDGRRSETRHRRIAIAGLVALLIGSAVGVAVPAGSGWDFANFFDTGRRVAAGEIDHIYGDPSTLIAGEAPQGNMRFWGAPLSAPLYAWLTAFDPGEAMVVFKIENVLALFAGLGILFLHLRGFRAPPDAGWRYAALFVALALAYQPFWTVFRVGGQTTPTVFLLLAIGWVAHTRRRFVASSLLLTLAVLIKPGLLPIVAFLMFVSGLRFAGVAALVGGVTAAVSVWWLGWPLHQQFLARVLGGVGEASPWMYNSAVTAPVQYLEALAGAPGRTVWGGAITWGIRVLALAACAAPLLLARRRGLPEAARLHLGFLAAVVFGLLAAPIVWEHYLALLFLLFAFLAAIWRRIPARGRVLASLAFGLAAIQNLIAILALERLLGPGRSPLVDLTASLVKSAPLVLAGVLLWRYRETIVEAHAGAFSPRPAAAPLTARTPSHAV